MNYGQAVRASRRRPSPGRSLLALWLSLLGHATGVGLFLLWSSLTGSGRHAPPKAQPFALRSLDARQWERNRGLAVSGPAAPRAMPERRAPAGQVVDVAPGNGREAPESKYLAETSNRVLKETRARVQAPVYSRATPTTHEAPEATPAAQGRAGGRASPPLPPVALVDRLTGTTGPKPRLSELLHDATPGTQAQHPDSAERAGIEGGEQNVSHAGDAAQAGGGAPNDDLRDVQAGEGTYLNTREWKFAGFFNRVKQAVSARWDPNGRLRAKGRQTIYADKVTLLSVTLRADGSLADVFVAQTSGIDALDLEAVQAFEHAQPFSNPPAGLAQNGLIRFNFGFSVISEGVGGPRMFGLGR